MVACAPSVPAVGTLASAPTASCMRRDMPGRSAGPTNPCQASGCATRWSASAVDVPSSGMSRARTSASVASTVRTAAPSDVAMSRASVSSAASGAAVRPIAATMLAASSSTGVFEARSHHASGASPSSSAARSPSLNARRASRRALRRSGVVSAIVGPTQARHRQQPSRCVRFRRESGTDGGGIGHRPRGRGRHIARLRDGRRIAHDVGEGRREGAHTSARSSSIVTARSTIASRS